MLEAVVPDAEGSHGGVGSEAGVGGHLGDGRVGGALGVGVEDGGAVDVVGEGDELEGAALSGAGDASNDDVLRAQGG
ncbi:hypothetical protein ACFQ51_52230, partial [Streptomyces kaempferi]